MTKGLYRKLLPAIGVDRNLPKEFRHATLMFQGLGLPEVVVEQTIEMVGYFLMHGAADTLTGEAMRASSEQVQIEVGVGQQFLVLPSKRFGVWSTAT